MGALSVKSSSTSAAVHDGDTVTLAVLAVKLALVKLRCIDVHQCYALSAADARKPIEKRRTQRLSAVLGWLVIDGVQRLPATRQRVLRAQPAFEKSRPVLARLCLLGLAALQMQPATLPAADAEVTAVDCIAAAFSSLTPSAVLTAVRTCGENTADAVERCVALLGKCIDSVGHAAVSRSALERVFDGAAAGAGVPPRVVRKRRRVQPSLSPTSSAEEAAVPAGGGNVADIDAPAMPAEAIDAGAASRAAGAAAVRQSHGDGSGDDSGDDDGRQVLVSARIAAADGGGSECMTARVLLTAEASCTAPGVGPDFAACLGGGTDCFAVACTFGGAAAVAKIPVAHRIVRHGVAPRVADAAAPPARSDTASMVSDVRAHCEPGVCELRSSASATNHGPCYLRVAELYTLLERAKRVPGSGVSADIAQAILGQRQGGKSLGAGVVTASWRATATAAGGGGGGGGAGTLLTARDALAALQQQRTGRRGVVGGSSGVSGVELFTVRPAEADMLHRCQHPYVLRLYTWEPGGVLVVERALIDVGELVRRCRELCCGAADGDVADREDGIVASGVVMGDLVMRLYLAATACIALAHIHSCGVMHMDIKYNNVMVQSSVGGGAGIGGDLQRIVCVHGPQYPWLGRFVVKLIDFSRAASIPGGVVSMSAAGGTPLQSVGVPADAVRVHRAAERYRDELAPELWLPPPLQPFHCPATDVYALVKRVLDPLFRHPARNVSMLHTLADVPTVTRLSAALLAALAHAPSQRPSAADISRLLVDALDDVAARADVVRGSI